MIPTDYNLVQFILIIFYPVLGFAPIWGYLFLKESKISSKAIPISIAISVCILILFFLPFPNKFFYNALQKTSIYSLRKHDIHILNHNYDDELKYRGISLEENMHFMAFPRYVSATQMIFCKTSFDPASKKDRENALDSLATCVLIKSSAIGLMRELKEAQDLSYR